MKGPFTDFETVKVPFTGIEPVAGRSGDADGSVKGTFTDSESVKVPFTTFRQAEARHTAAPATPVLAILPHPHPSAAHLGAPPRRTPHPSAHP
ncbi:hypothetical protein D5S19_13365, partial [Amycolatopsis panacis]